MDGLAGTAGALVVTLPIVLAMVVGVVFSVLARARAGAPVDSSASLLMLGDGSVVEISEQAQPAFVA